MFDRVIVAFHDMKTRKLWIDVAKAVAADWGGAEIAKCLDVSMARQMLRGAGSRDLLILAVDLPEDAEEPDTETAPAISLVHELQKRAAPPACVLVGPANNRISSELSALKLAGMLVVGAANEADLIGDLAQLAEVLAAKRDKRQAPGPPPPQSWALLEVHLDGKSSRCGLRIGQGNRIESLPEVPLELDESLLSKFMAASRDLRQKMNNARAKPRLWEDYVKQWQGEYQVLGRTIYDLIGTGRFQYFWGRAQAEANDNIRLRFVLNEDMYDGLWESMWDPIDEWMMLKGTITRQARSLAAPPAHRLDGGDGVVHVLAIGSNVPDGSIERGPPDQGWKTFWNAFNGNLAEDFFRVNKRGPRLNEVFPPLKEIEGEMNVLRTLETEVNKRRPGKIDLEVLEGPAGDKTLYERVKDYLTAGQREGGSARCDVVHFAGHALFNDVGTAHDRGYLVFGGSPHTDFVPVSAFARLLKEAGVQMVYLSCCQSSAARAAFDLAGAGIPLAIGFTWDLDSELAVGFATAFYTELLQDLKVCRAFQSARKALALDIKSGDPIWASPVLVAQPREWRSVEGYMVAAN